MSDNKRYYYLRLRENFFDTPELKTIEAMRGGYKYSNILLKLYLLSLRGEGRLTLTENIPYDISMLANLTGFSKIEVENALKIFRKFGLVEILDSGTIYMLDIQNFIGKSSTSADRQRKFDRRIEAEKCKKSYKISVPEKEIEKEIEIESIETPPSAAPTTTKKRFIPPTLEQVAEYVKQRGSKVDPQGFIDFYESKGWMVGKTPMKDWKAACRNAEHWERWKQNTVPSEREPVQRKKYRTEIVNGEEVDVLVDQ